MTSLLDRLDTVADDAVQRIVVFPLEEARGHRRRFRRRSRSFVAGAVFVAAAMATAAGVTGHSRSVSVHVSGTGPSTPADTRTFTVPSAAMEPTLTPGEVVMVVHQSSLKRGDIVVLNTPPQYVPGMTETIKRIVGLPGETISAAGGTLYIDGRKLVEPWNRTGVPTPAFGPVTIPLGEYFVLGDNRSNSADSRVFGSVGQSLVLGVATKIAAPPNQTRSLLP